MEGNTEELQRGLGRAEGKLDQILTEVRQLHSGHEAQAKRIHMNTQKIHWLAGLAAAALAMKDVVLKKLGI